jgi:hypothetical protein
MLRGQVLQSTTCTTRHALGVMCSHGHCSVRMRVAIQAAYKGTAGPQSGCPAVLSAPNSHGTTCPHKALHALTRHYSVTHMSQSLPGSGSSSPTS